MPVPPTPRLILRLAWRNVRRNWRHSAAALGTMAVGFLALALFQGYLDELLRSQLELVHSRNMIGEILVRKPGQGTRLARTNPARYYLEEKEQAFLEGWLAQHQAQVRTRVRTLFVRGLASAGSASAEFFAMGHDVPEGRLARGKWAWNAYAGRPLQDDDQGTVLLAMGLAAVLGCERTGDEPVMDKATGTPTPVARPFHCKQETLMLSTTSAHGRMNALEAEVVGLTTAAAREFDLRFAWLPLPFAQSLAETRGVSTYMVMLNRPAEAAALRQALRRDAQAAGLELEVVDWQDTEGAELLRRGLELMSVYRSLVVVVILIIAGAAVLTTMMKTVRERTREVGTLRSLGYRSRHMLAMFAVEAALLAAHAGAAGLLAAVALTAAINGSGVTYKAGLLAESIPLRVGYSPAAYAWGFLFLAAVAVAAAVAAARKVAGMPIAQALSES